MMIFEPLPGQRFGFVTGFGDYVDMAIEELHEFIDSFECIWLGIAFEETLYVGETAVVALGDFGADHSPKINTEGGLGGHG